jgi:hypothetical protein
LFNDLAWSKVDGVLSEILDVFYSVPPDENFYFFQLSALKGIKREKLGIPLIRCTRGANTVERTYKWMVPVFGSNYDISDQSQSLYVDESNDSAIRPTPVSDAIVRSVIGEPQVRRLHEF